MRVLLWLILAGSFLRLVFLNSVPPGISHDELDFVNNGYSMVKTGRDLAGAAFPLTVGGVGHVALPAYLSGVTTGFLGLSLWSVRLAPAILGILSIVIIYGISRCLFSSSRAALASSLFLAISPWGLKISRVMFDPPIALFFYLLAIWLTVSARRPARLVLAVIFLGLGFIGYYGTIFTYLPVLLSLLIYQKNLLLKSPRIRVILILVIVTTGLVFLLMLTGGNRQKTFGRSPEIFLTDTVKISDNVIFDRYHSRAPVWSDRLFINKATYVLNQFGQNYLAAFNPVMIFITGDPNRIYGLWNRGELPLFTLPLICVGFFVAYRRYRRAFWFLLVLLLAAPLTTGFTSQVFATRAFLLWPVLLVFAGLGCRILLNYLTRLPPLLKKTVNLMLVVGILFNLTATLHQYFFRYPVYAAEMWFDSEKQLARYLGSGLDYPITVLSPEPRAVFMEFVFYVRPDPATVQSVWRSSPISFGRLSFTGCTAAGAPVGISVIHYTCLRPAAAVPLIRARDQSNRVIWYLSSQKP